MSQVVLFVIPQIPSQENWRSCGCYSHVLRGVLSIVFCIKEDEWLGSKARLFHLFHLY